MITSVVVSYRVRPEAVAEHVRLIEAVFEQLRTEKTRRRAPATPSPVPVHTYSFEAGTLSVDRDPDRPVCAVNPFLRTGTDHGAGGTQPPLRISPCTRQTATYRPASPPTRQCDRTCRGSMSLTVFPAASVSRFRRLGIGR